MKNITDFLLAAGAILPGSGIDAMFSSTARRIELVVAPYVPQNSPSLVFTQLWLSSDYAEQLYTSEYGGLSGGVWLNVQGYQFPSPYTPTMPSQQWDDASGAICALGLGDFANYLNHYADDRDDVTLAKDSGNDWYVYSVDKGVFHHPDDFSKDGRHTTVNISSTSALQAGAACGMQQIGTPMPRHLDLQFFASGVNDFGEFATFSQSVGNITCTSLDTPLCDELDSEGACWRTIGYTAPSDAELEYAFFSSHDCRDGTQIFAGSESGVTQVSFDSHLLSPYRPAAMAVIARLE